MFIGTSVTHLSNTILSQIHDTLSLVFVCGGSSKGHFGKEENALFCYYLKWIRLYLKISLTTLTKSLKIRCHHEFIYVNFIHIYICNWNWFTLIWKYYFQNAKGCFLFSNILLAIPYLPYPLVLVLEFWFRFFSISFNFRE